MRITYADTRLGRRTIWNPETLSDWRGMATGMLINAEALGVPKSQLPKYDLSSWGMVGVYFPGSDRSDQAVTPTQISEKLLEHNIRRTRHNISHIIYDMINRHKLAESYPHWRNIGRRCVQFVKDMGGIKYNTLMPEQTGLRYIVKAYYFGKSHDKVVEVRRLYGLSIRG